MSDLISRQAVLAIVKDSYLDLGKFEDSRVFCAEIKALPSVENKGEWIKMGGFMLGPTYKCSNCGIRVVIEYGKKYKCCPNCEANMRMGKEGDNSYA